MTVHKSLGKEAAAWKLERKTLQGPNRDHFIIEREGAFWRLSIYPKNRMPKIIPGLTPGEANRMRFDLSTEGFVGKVIE